MLFNHKITNTHAYLSGSIDRNVKNVTPACFYKDFYTSSHYGLWKLHKTFVSECSYLVTFPICPSVTSSKFKVCVSQYTFDINKVHELIAVKVLHNSLLNTTVVAFKVLPFGSYAPMTVPSPPFKTILEMVLWKDLQSCYCIIPDVIHVIKMPSFQYFLYLRDKKKSHWILDPVNRQGVPTQLFA